MRKGSSSRKVLSPSALIQAARASWAAPPKSAPLRCYAQPSTHPGFENVAGLGKMPDGDALMANNFLPDFQPYVTAGTKKTLQCLIRDKAVFTTPEELVRQRILYWLIDSKGWSKDDLRWRRATNW